MLLFFLEKIEHDLTLLHFLIHPYYRPNLLHVNSRQFLSLGWVKLEELRTNCEFFRRYPVQCIFRPLCLLAIFAHQRRRANKKSLQNLQHNYCCNVNDHIQMCKQTQGTTLLMLPFSKNIFFNVRYLMYLQSLNMKMSQWRNENKVQTVHQKFSANKYLCALIIYQVKLYLLISDYLEFKLKQKPWVKKKEIYISL